MDDRNPPTFDKLKERFYRWCMSPEAWTVYVALKDPNAWSKNDHTITHKRSGVVFWTSNNQFHPYRPLDESKFFGWWEQRVLRRAYRKTLRAQLFINLLGIDR